MKKFGKRALAILLSGLLLMSMVSVISAESDAATTDNGVTVYEDNYLGVPTEGVLNGLKVENNTITGSDFTVEMAEGHSWRFDDSRGEGLTWWIGNADNSGLKIGFDEVTEGVLTASYTFWTQNEGDLGSLINGTVADHQDVVSVKKVGDAVGNVSVGSGVTTTVVTTVDLTKGTYIVRVGKNTALEGTIESGTAINGLYFDVEGNSSWEVIKNVKVEISESGAVTFADENGTALATEAIENGIVTAPEYTGEIPEGKIFVGWKNDSTDEIFAAGAEVSAKAGAVLVAVLKKAPAVKGGMTIYEDDYQKGGYSVANNTITNSAFDVELAEGHRYTGALVWSGAGTVENSAAKFGFDAVNSGILKVSYSGMVQSALPGNVGSLRNGTTPVVEVKLTNDGSCKIAGKNVTHWTALTVETIVNFTTLEYRIYVNNALAKSGEIPEGAVIDNIFFDIESGSEYRPVYNIKAMVSTGGVTFLDEMGDLIGVQEIVDGKVSAPDNYTPQDGANLIGWKDEIYGTIVNDITAVDVVDGAVYKAILDVVNIDVANETELRNAISTASTDGVNTIITLANDIDITQTSSIEIAANQKITLKGAKTLTKKATSSNSLFNVKGALTIKDVTIDMNADEVGGGRVITANTSGVNAVVTIAGNTVIKDGIASTDGTIYIQESNTLIIKDNAKITGFAPAEGKNGYIINQNWHSTVRIEGGEISGNTVKGAGLINGGGNYGSVTITAGKIKDNTYLDEKGYAVSLGGTGKSIAVSGDAEIEGIIKAYSSVKINSALQYPLTFEYSGTLTLGKMRDDNNGPWADLYSNVIAEGNSGYTLTQADLDKMEFTDTTKYLYLDPTARSWETKLGRVMLLDVGTENTHEEVIYKSTYIPPAEYTVNFYTLEEGAENNTVFETQTVAEGLSAKTPEKTPTKAPDGSTVYIFSHWDKDYSNITGDLDVYPVYDAIESEVYDVVFKNWDGTELDTQQVIEGEAATAPENPTKTVAGETWKFIGWDIAFDNVTENLTVTAQFVQTFKVTFKGFGGTTIKTVTVESGQSASAPNIPEIPGYTADGWDIAFSNVTSDLTVTAQYTYTHDPEVPYEITTAGQLKQMMEYAPNDGTKVILELKNDISFSEVWWPMTAREGFSDSTFLTAGKDIIIKGNGYTIKKTSKMNENRRLYVGAAEVYGGLFVIKGANVEFNDVIIDVNDYGTGDSTTAISVKSGNVKLTGTTTLKGGRGWNERRGMAVGISGSGVFTMEDESMITDFIASSDTANKGNGLIAFDGGGKFVMNGGTITGNTVKNYGLIGMEAQAQGRNSAVELNGGKIVDNTWLDADGYAVRMLADTNAQPIYLGGNTQLEGAIAGNSGSHNLQITGKINHSVKIVGKELESYRRDEDNNPMYGYYDAVIAEGANGYTLTASDLNSIVYTDAGKILYLDMSNGKIYAMDANKEPMYDTWVMQGGEVTPQPIPTSLAIEDATLANGKVTVTYKLSGDRGVTGKPIAAIYQGGALKGVNYAEATGAINIGTDTIEITTDLTSLAGTEIKVFIWDSATIKPLVDVATRSN